MRELAVRLRFTNQSLGNQKQPDGGFVFQRSQGRKGKLLFLASWHQSNMTWAAGVLGRHQEAVKRIFWDIETDAELQARCLVKCFYKKTATSRMRYSTHEALLVGQTIGINCVVPAEIDDQDFWELLQIAGKYRGLSPWQPGRYGHYEVVTVRPRRQQQESATPSQREPNSTGVDTPAAG